MNSQQIGQVSSIIWFVLLIGIFYLFLIRPQQKQAKKHQELIAGLEKGDKVITIGGIYGKIVVVKEETVSLEVAQDVIIEVSRGAISRRRESNIIEQSNT